MGARVLSYGSEFSCFDIYFFRKVTMSDIGPLKGLAPPPKGNPGSATMLLFGTKTAARNPAVTFNVISSLDAKQV